ncbi:MAG TPA: leucine-rich repeat domain-containing protein, partial [Candidatus Absconditabacterales bacterium]|nr:leucine-rich repeat domain-containing protein [Candidatus Absconditabacterales bacterium]
MENEIKVVQGLLAVIKNTLSQEGIGHLISELTGSEKKQALLKEVDPNEIITFLEDLAQTSEVFQQYITEKQIVISNENSWKDINFVGKYINLFRDLKELDLCETNLESLPDWISQLQNLEELLLSNTRIKSLPDWISQLQNLKQLRLSNTGITSLPESISQ